MAVHPCVRLSISDLHVVAGGRIVLSGGSAVDYDWLVLSMGSESSTLGIPGVKEFAVLFNTISDALQASLVPNLQCFEWWYRTQLC